MHADCFRWLIWMLAGCSFILGGCQGAGRFSQMVQVRQAPNAVIPEFDSPRQRLATPQPRAGLLGEFRMEEKGQPNDERRQSLAKSPASTESVALTSASAPPTPASVAAPPRRAPSAAEQVAKQARAKAADKPLQSVAASAPKEQVSGNVAMDQDELMQAFHNSPPEVQQQAMRQLIAAIARTAESTAHPEALDRALTASLSDLPALPAESKVPATVPPNRLAMASDEGSSEPNNQADGKSPADKAIVQTAAAQSDAAQESNVRPVSAAHENSDPAMVAQAAVTPAPEKVLDMAPEKVLDKASEAKPSLDQMSDQQLYDILLRRLLQAPSEETEAQRSRRLIVSRHLMVLAGDPDRAVAETKDLSPEEQQYLRYQLLGLWTIIDPEGHPVPSRRFTTALPQLREATKYLAAATDSLEVQSLAFCTEIEAYGQIKRFPGNRFDAGQQVILYCEIENFTVTTVDGGYETHLQGSYDIFNASNEKVVSQLLPADRQISGNYLRDYFIAYQMNLPKQLSKGAYRLQLTMEDVAGKKYGQASIPLDIK